MKQSYEYDELKKEPSKLSKFRLLIPGHGDNEGILKNLPGNHADRRQYNRLVVTRTARECSEWLKQRCEVSESPSSVRQNLNHLIVRYPPMRSVRMKEPGSHAANNTSTHLAGRLSSPSQMCLRDIQGSTSNE